MLQVLSYNCRPTKPIVKNERLLYSNAALNHWQELEDFEVFSIFTFSNFLFPFRFRLNNHKTNKRT